MVKRLSTASTMFTEQPENDDIRPNMPAPGMEDWEVRAWDLGPRDDLASDSSITDDDQIVEAEDTAARARWTEERAHRLRTRNTLYHITL